MSNCLDLYNSEVIFTNEDIDLKKLCEYIRSSKTEIVFPEPEEYIRYHCWWFLVEGRNVIIREKNSVIQHIKINFGHGRSSHTWRDFRGLILTVFNPLMKRKKRHFFVFEDKDMQTGRFRRGVTFGEKNPF